MLTTRWLIAVAIAGSAIPPGTCRGDLHDDALAAAKKAAAFYRGEVATEGGYLWRYSADLRLREGEGKQSETTVWVQPPGTPAMGEVFVRLYDATGDEQFLEAARAAADALRRGQLRSGGWNNGIDFSPEARARYAYRVEPPGRKRRDISSLDDDKTQSSVRFLIRLDRATDFQDPVVHDIVTYALDALLRAQYPNGGFPQVWDEPYDPAEHPVQPASYPESWSRVYQGHQQYWYRYTLNDNLMPDVLALLFLAEDTYGERRFHDAAIRAADFLLLAQMPDPQPAWAQQYDFDMHPIWARKFEPAAVTGGESQGVMRALMEVYRRTGNRKYLQPVPKALAYLKSSLLPDGQLARFYELRTNRPLYFTRDYQLTYDDSDMPTHYAFKVSSKLDQIGREYQKLAATPPDQLQVSGGRGSQPSDAAVRRIVDTLDPRGAWVTEGGLKYQPYEGPVIDMRVAVGNFRTLADFLAAAHN